MLMKIIENSNDVSSPHGSSNHVAPRLNLFLTSKIFVVPNFMLSSNLLTSRLKIILSHLTKYVVHADESVLFSSTKAIEQHFYVALFIMLHRVVLTLSS